jgi:hypothetical protein
LGEGWAEFYLHGRRCSLSSSLRAKWKSMSGVIDWKISQSLLFVRDQVLRQSITYLGLSVTRASPWHCLLYIGNPIPERTGAEILPLKRKSRSVKLREMDECDCI